MLSLLPEILSIFIQIIAQTTSINENDLLNQNFEENVKNNAIEEQIISIFWDERTNKYDIKNGTLPGCVAWANFTNQIEKNG